MEIKPVVTLFLIMSFYGFAITMHFIRTHIYVGELMSWSEAQQYCRLHYDDLSTIRSKLENNQMPYPEDNYALGLNEYRYAVWIGLYTNSSDSPNWKWSGENTSFTMWKNEPDISVKEGCAYFDIKSKEWNADSCSLNLTFFCMEDSPKLILVRSYKTWEEALNYCRNNYDDLASLRSDEEIVQAVKKSKAAKAAQVWTGLHFVFKHWIWMNGHALEYQAWSKEGQPNCPDRKHSCGALETDKNTWIPQNCEDKLYFLCLKKVNAHK